MMRSLFSGVSGLRVHQTKMDVIGNNIANINTVAFKASRVTFSEVFQQTTQSATGANVETNRGGTNARQIGLGTTVGSIFCDPTSEGSNQRTDNPYDLKISGDNFFIVNDGAMNYFTKVGAFTTDAAGYLVTQYGYHVMGWQVDPTTGDIKQDIVSELGITTPENMSSPPQATTNTYFTGNIDKTNTDVTGDGLVTSMTIYDKQGYSYTVKYNIKQDPANTGDNSLYSMQVTDILDSRNRSILMPAGGTATAGNVGIYNVALGVGGNQAQPPDTIMVKYNADTGNFVTVSTAANGAAGGATADEAFTLSITTTVTDPTTGVPIDNFEDITIDMSTTTQYAASGKCTITSVRGDLDGIGAGRTSGKMSGVSVGTDGKITATYDNGDTKLLGQISVASFSNAAGLEKLADGLYTTTPNSGEFDGIGKDPTDGGGSVTQGVLEMSNVDLSNEFTEMITTQRGFQANSRIITVSDSMLEELVNLKR